MDVESRVLGTLGLLVLLKLRKSGVDGRRLRLAKNTPATISGIRYTNPRGLFIVAGKTAGMGHPHLLVLVGVLC